MKRHNFNLKWMVWRYDGNNNSLETINVLSEELLEKAAFGVATKKIKNRDMLKRFFEREFKYKYWSRCEYEMMVGDLFIKDTDSLKKVDVYGQLEPNLDTICDYFILAADVKFKGTDTEEDPHQFGVYRF